MARHSPAVGCVDLFAQLLMLAGDPKGGETQEMIGDISAGKEILTLQRRVIVARTTKI